jgi:HK97 family phage major capsid protein
VTIGVGREDGDRVNEIEIIIEERPAVSVRSSSTREGTRMKTIEDRNKEVSSILTIGTQMGHPELARKCVESGASVDEFRSALLDAMGNTTPLRPTGSMSELGLADREARSFSFIKAIAALANPSDRRAQESAGFEFEVSKAACQKLGRDTRGIHVPSDVLRGRMTRDLTVGTATAGGHTVATDLLAASFIDLLANASVVFPRATKLTGLVGNVAIPRQTSGAGAYWVAESGAPTETQQAFDQVTLTPRTVGAFTDVSRKLLIQSSLDAEGLVRMDLARTLGIEIDRVCINGSGTAPEPRGILSTTGIGSVALGTNGAAPSWANLPGLLREVEIDNALTGSLVFITNPKVRATLLTTVKVSGQPSYLLSEPGNTLLGHDLLVTNQVPSNLTKGTGTGLSALLFGNASDLLVGMWSGLDLIVDPYTMSTSGTVRVVALQDCDVAVRHPESFAAIVDMITS